MSSQSVSDPVEDWCRAFEAGREHMHGLLNGLSREQLNFRPASRQWSVGQCVDHLSVSMGVYLDPLERAVETARAEGRTGSAPYAPGPRMGRLLLRALRKPSGRYWAPPSFRPRSGELDPANVRERFERQIGRLKAAAGRADGLALGSIEMPWPAFSLIKLSLAQAFELQALHIHRHLAQAERVRQASSFPGDGAAADTTG